MLFSIITPTSNSEKFLKHNIKSIKNQKCRDIEHIFIDNQSKDRTIKILKRYQRDANFRVKIISKTELEIMNKKLLKIKNKESIILEKTSQKITFLLGNIYEKLLSKSLKR